MRFPDDQHLDSIERQLAAQAGLAPAVGHRDRVLAAVWDTLAENHGGPPRAGSGIDAGATAALVAMALSATLVIVAPWLVATRAGAPVPTDYHSKGTQTSGPRKGCLFPRPEIAISRRQRADWTAEIINGSGPIATTGPRRVCLLTGCVCPRPARCGHKKRSTSGAFRPGLVASWQSRCVSRGVLAGRFSRARTTPHNGPRKPSAWPA